MMGKYDNIDYEDQRQRVDPQKQNKTKNNIEFATGRVKPQKQNKNYLQPIYRAFSLPHAGR